MSGSSVADVAGLGSIEIKEMVQRNYGLKYATAITVTSSTMAVVMPPSILLIIYATIANVSVGAALAAGLVPGVVTGLFLILTNTGIALKKFKVKTVAFSFRRVVNTGLSGLPALLAPAIILGGIFLGTFTPTEASAIAFLYALALGLFFYRELNADKLYKILYEGGRTSGIVALELAAGLLFANLMTLEGIPSILVELMAGAQAPPFLIMLGLSGILLLAGMFLNPGFSIIVFTPLLLPIAESIGYDPLHFGVIMVMNLALGLITPPVGACLYMGSVVSGLPVEQIIGQLKPFYLLMLFLLLLIIIVPQLSTGFVDLIY
jgi:C4-dicarboxylate transporter DctM subunit